MNLSPRGVLKEEMLNLLALCETKFKSNGEFVGNEMHGVILGMNKGGRGKEGVAVLLYER